jgi:hypothetical protein
VTPGDCYLNEGIELTLKTLSLYQKKVQVAAGVIEGVNPFPDKFKVVSNIANHLPILLLQEMDKSLLVQESAHEFMV